MCWLGIFKSSFEYKLGASTILVVSGVLPEALVSWDDGFNQTIIQYLTESFLGILDMLELNLLGLKMYPEVKV